MARGGVFEASLALVLLATLCVQSSAQTSSCAPVLSSLAPCISYIVGNSSAPDSTCCSQLAAVVQTQTRCLCAILTGGITQLGFLVNQTQALMLPGACKIRMSSSSPCSGITASVPAAAPTLPQAPAPAAAPPAFTAPAPASVPSDSTPSVPSASTPSVPSASAPSGSGSKTTTETSMARSSTKFTPAVFFFFLLFVASYA